MIGTNLAFKLAYSNYQVADMHLLETSEDIWWADKTLES